MLKRLPTDFQHKALLRVHADSFARRDAKELGIESIRQSQQASISGMLSDLVRLRTSVPPPLRQCGGHRIVPFRKHPPETFGRRPGRTRNTTARTNDRDRLVLFRLEFGDPLLRVLQREESLLQR